MHRDVSVNSCYLNIVGVDVGSTNSFHSIMVDWKLRRETLRISWFLRRHISDGVTTGIGVLDVSHYSCRDIFKRYEDYFWFRLAEFHR